MFLSTIKFIYLVSCPFIMKAEEHLRAFHEHRAVVDWAVDRGLEQSQRIIGVHASRGAIGLLSYYLHKEHKIDVGFQLNHRWFKSPRVGERLPEFENKGVILPKLIQLETQCENLSYGSQKPETDIKGVLQLFNETENMLQEMIGNEK
jgi:hypothetical protein